ncbi:MAG: hypothetical protein WB607_26665 [Candidatus Acidiferrum sp.]
MNTTHFRPLPHAQQLRSQRILLSVSMVISGERANGAVFSERTNTLVVNARRTLIQLHEQVLFGQPLRMKNLATNEETNCTVVDINQRSRRFRGSG